MPTLAILFFWALVCSLVGALIGQHKGRALAGFLFGLFIGPIGWLLVALGPDLRRRQVAPVPSSRGGATYGKAPISAEDPDIQDYLARKNAVEATAGEEPAPAPLRSQYPAFRQAPPPAPVQSSNSVALPVIMLVVGIVLGAALKTGLDAAGAFTPQREVVRSHIRYEVTGSGTRSAMITYALPDGGQEQVIADLPWSRELSAHSGAALAVVAQNGENQGSVTTLVHINGRVASSNTSAGGYTLATSRIDVP